MFEKIWSRHVVAQRDDGETLLYVDRNFVHEGPFYAFDGLRRDGRRIRRPLKQIAVSDHYLPTVGRKSGIAGIADPDIRTMIERLAVNAREFGVPFIGIDDPRQGIMHVVGPELALAQPGMIITGADSHTTTNGAFGALAFGIGASEVKHVLATQALWQRNPRTLRVTVDGALPKGVTAKDVILAIIAKIGVRGGSGHIIEYAGSTIRAMTMEQRMTICNMSIEAGAKAGMIAPDETTYAYLEGRDHAPRGDLWNKALAVWRTLPSEAGARFDKEVALSARDIVPMVTWGTTPEDALPVTEKVPDPSSAATADERAHIERALRYMDLTPGLPLVEVRVDRVFIGSCTNARIEDLRAAAAVVKGKRITVPAFISPGSTAVKRRAEAEGLDRVFLAAGFEWRDSACSMCVGANGDFAAPGERCASTSPRNFENRQGRGVRTHVMSPPMAAAAALTGKLTDVRTLS
ncbi:MAG: 3-isopropylmalate dehydratase large subunit [Betaproteobacteria bacterium]|nr:3-isopropylmalate dehydratase large subunit [Betaproteobacteria bacterium]